MGSPQYGNYHLCTIRKNYGQERIKPKDFGRLFFSDRNHSSRCPDSGKYKRWRTVYNYS